MKKSKQEADSKANSSSKLAASGSKDGKVVKGAANAVIVRAQIKRTGGRSFGAHIGGREEDPDKPHVRPKRIYMQDVSGCKVV